jgi:hypothetical protein
MLLPDRAHEQGKELHPGRPRFVPGEQPLDRAADKREGSAVAMRVDVSWLESWLSNGRAS